MRAKEFINELKIDNRNGWGQVPYNQDIDYFGLRVLMRPSVFLKLAAPLYEPTSKEAIKIHIAQGGSIGAPFLQIAIPKEWENGDFSKPAAVYGHEGRNRMLAIKELEGDAPIEVHLLPNGGMRARNLTPDIVSELNNRLLPEGQEYEWALFSGPYFSRVPHENK